MKKSGILILRNSPEFSGIQFSVASESETSDGARIVITHDGNDRATYYGFATTDVGADVNSLVNREARRLAGSGAEIKSQLKQGGQARADSYRSVLRNRVQIYSVRPE